MLDQTNYSTLRTTKPCLFPPESIDCSGAWIFWKTPPSALLQYSIKTCGQLSPVLISQKENTRQLITGWARVQCLHALDKPVLCQEVQTQDPRENGFLYLLSNTERPRTESQQLQALRFFSLDKETGHFEDIWPLLDLSPQTRQARLLQIWLSLDPIWDTLLYDQRLPLACGDALQLFSPEEHSHLYPLLKNFSWSRGNAINFLTWLGETCKRENRPLYDLPGAEALQAVEPTLSPRDAMAKLCDIARNLRYPHLLQLEAHLAASIAALDLKEWKITQADMFESSRMDFYARFASPEDVHRGAQKLQKIAYDPALEALFSEPLSYNLKSIPAGE